MLKLSLPLVVEGKYDKARLAQVVDTTIVTTEGFGIFNNQEKTALLRRIGQRGIIVLCDSDGGGTVIRSHLKSALNGKKIYDLYIPQIPGKERRKRQAGKAGFLGVEGMDNQTLENLFLRLAEAHPEILASSQTQTDTAEAAAPVGEITKTDLFCLGLTGGEGSSERRDALCAHIGFPKGMTPNALLSALQMLYTPETLAELCGDLFGER